ncbi:MAG: hypothetical protein MOB07_08865 [Acidobacteria bacterium]|nr:hypothetical protein [Acidobacteriota bacterium]
MQQPCQRCGYVSDRPTRFCRQCGAQLFVENEATSASTRQYVPQQSANPYDAPYQSQLAQAQAAPDHRFDYQTPDTSRLYPTPMAPKLSNYPTNYQPAESKKSSAWKWILIGLLCVMLVGVGIGAMVISAIHARQPAEENAASETGARAPIPPIPPLPPSTSGAGIDRYKYPNAEVKSSVGVFGNNVVTMSTRDSVSEVKEYYKKQFGDPMVEDEDGDTVIFQIQGSPTIVITIGVDKQDSDKTEINLIRTNLELPKMN